MKKIKAKKFRCLGCNHEYIGYQRRYCRKCDAEIVKKIKTVFDIANETNSTVVVGSKVADYITDKTLQE